MSQNTCPKQAIAAANKHNQSIPKQAIAPANTVISKTSSSRNKQTQHVNSFKYYKHTKAYLHKIRTQTDFKAFGFFEEKPTRQTKQSQKMNRLLKMNILIMNLVSFSIC